MPEQFIATVENGFRLVELDEYVRNGAPGYSKRTKVHIVQIFEEPRDQERREWLLEGAFRYLRYNEYPECQLGITTMLAGDYFEGVADNRIPTIEDVELLGGLPLVCHNDEPPNHIENPIVIKDPRYAVFAIINTSNGPIPYEHYKEDGFPGIAWDTEIWLGYSQWSIDPSKVTDNDKLSIFNRYLAGETQPDCYVFELAYAHEDFQYVDSKWKSLTHKLVIPNLDAPKWVANL